jgi:hypothetical protein
LFVSCPISGPGCVGALLTSCLVGGLVIELVIKPVSVRVAELVDRLLVGLVGGLGAGLVGPLVAALIGPLVPGLANPLGSERMIRVAWAGFILPVPEIAGDEKVARWNQVRNPHPFFPQIAAGLGNVPPQRHRVFKLG